jgi:hypothetical protein
MKTIIHKLRQHPEHIRRKMLYVATIASFFLLLGLWSFSINATVTSSDNAQASIAGDLKPFQMLKASIIDSTKKLSWPFGKTTVVNNPPSDTSDSSTSTASGVVPVVSTPDTTMDTSTDTTVDTESTPTDTMYDGGATDTTE